MKFVLVSVRDVLDMLDDEREKCDPPHTDTAAAYVRAIDRIELCVKTMPKISVEVE